MTKTWFEQTPSKGDGKLLDDAGLNFTVEKQPLHLPNGQEALNLSALTKSTDDQIIYRAVPSDFEVIQPSDFERITERIAGSIHSAGHINDGEIVWFTAEPKDTTTTYTINGDIYANYVLFALSYASKIGVSIVPIAYNVTQDIILNVSELLNKKAPTLRQTKNIKKRINEDINLNATYKDCVKQLNQFRDKLETLSRAKEDNITEILDIFLPVPPQDKSTPRKHNSLLKLRNEIKRNHKPSRGTSRYSIFLAIYETDIRKYDKRRQTLPRRFFANKVSPIARQVLKAA